MVSLASGLTGIVFCDCLNTCKLWCAVFSVRLLSWLTMVMNGNTMLVMTHTHTCVRAQRNTKQDMTDLLCLHQAFLGSLINSSHFL